VTGYPNAGKIGNRRAIYVSTGFFNPHIGFPERATVSKYVIDLEITKSLFSTPLDQVSLESAVNRYIY